MPDGDRDPWRLPTLEAFGHQLEGIGASERRPKRRPALVSSGAIVAIVLAVALLLQGGGTAGALSIINRAPAAAIRSATVLYRSAIAISLGNGPARRFTQEGEIDFAGHAYEAKLGVVGSDGGVEWRSVGGVLYRTERARAGGAARRTPWIAARLSTSQRGALAAAPEKDAITDPLAVLRVLAQTTARPVFIGDDQVEGVRCREYRIASNLSSVLRASSGATRLPGVYSRVAAVLDVSLDAAGRPRRVSQRFSFRPGSGTDVLASVLTFSGYGARVTVAPPPGVTPGSTLHGAAPAPLIGGPSRIYEHLIAHPH